MKLIVSCGSSLRFFLFTFPFLPGTVVVATGGFIGLAASIALKQASGQRAMMLKHFRAICGIHIFFSGQCLSVYLVVGGDFRHIWR